MESSRGGDNRPLGSQIKEAMEIEELRLNVKKLKKNMTYVIKFLQYQLEQMPTESAEEEEQITKERAFITGRINILSHTVTTLLIEPSNSFDSINSDQFVTILNRYKDIFTDVLIGSRSLSDEKDESLVAKSALTISTSQNYKNVLAAIDQLVDVYDTATLSDYFKHAVQEKNFSFLIYMKGAAKMHHGINDQEASDKLKMVFNKLFSAEKYQGLRAAFFAAVNDPTIERNITALQENCEYKEEKGYQPIYETEEDKKHEINDNEVKLTQDKMEKFIASTEEHRELHRQDGPSEIKNKNLLQKVKEKNLRIKALKRELKEIQKERKKEEVKLQEPQVKIDASVRPEEQLGPKTYEDEKEKFEKYLSKLENKTIKQKAKDILTAVENAKSNKIALDQELVGTLFLTNQFLEKITSGKEINDRMCLDYKTLAKNLDKNPLGKKIAGAMTAFLGAVILALQLPFMKYKTGWNLLGKGIAKHQGTKSIAENSLNFLEKVRSVPKK